MSNSQFLLLLLEIGIYWYLFVFIGNFCFYAKNATHFYCSVPAKSGRVSPFGHHRIKASWQLPGDYRGHVRPSSENATKASTVCVI